MIPSDHFVRFYNEVFKFLAQKQELDSYYKQRTPLRQMMTQLIFGKKT